MTVFYELLATLLATAPWLIGPVGHPAMVMQGVVSGLALLSCLVLSARSPRWWHVVAHAWLLAAVLSVLIALLQYFDATAGLQPWVSASANGEAFSNLRQRNLYASLCLLGLASCLWLLRAHDKGQVPVALMLCGVLLIVGNAISQSRTGLLGLVVLVALGHVWRASSGRKVHRLLLAALPLYVLAAWAMPIIASHGGVGWGALSRFSDGEASCQSRLTLWSNVLHLIAQKPWAGWGLGELDYAHYVTLYPGARFCAILDNAHNLPLHIAVEFGVPAALAGCFLLGYLVLRLRPWAEQDPDRQLAWSVLTLVALHSLLEYPLWYGPFAMAVLLSVLLLWRTAHGKPASTISAFATMPPLRQLGLGMLAMGFLGLMFYIAWDFRRYNQIYLPQQYRAPEYASDTLNKIRATWLFRGPANFSALSMTALTPQNAAEQNRLANEVLHFSPEPMVIQRVIESAFMLNQEDQVVYQMPRFEAAFPQAYQTWQKATPPQSSPTSPRASPAASLP